MIENMGYKGEGGLGKNKDVSTVVVERVHERRGKDKTGVYAIGIESIEGLPKSKPILQLIK